MVRIPRHAPLGAAVLALSLTPVAWAAQHSVTTSGDLGFDDKSISEFVRRHSAGAVNPLRLDKAEITKRDFLYGFGNRFRLIAATDPGRLRRTFAPRDKAPLAELLDTKAYRDAPGIWRYFFRSSLIYVGLLKSPVVRIGFYNPIVDGWVMTDWSWRGLKIRLIGADVASGEAVRGEKVTGATRVSWIARAQGSLAGNIRDATGIAGFAFARSYPMLGAEPPPRFRRSPDTDFSRAVVESRLVGMLANLNRHYRSVPMTAASETLIRAVASGDAGSLKRLTTSIGPRTLYRIAGLPTAIRKNLELTGNFPTTSGAVLTFGMPMMSRWMLIAHYAAKKGDGEGKIDGIAFLEVTPRTIANRGEADAKQ